MNKVKIQIACIVLANISAVFIFQCLLQQGVLPNILLISVSLFGILLGGVVVMAVGASNIEILVASVMLIGCVSLLFNSTSWSFYTDPLKYSFKIGLSIGVLNTLVYALIKEISFREPLSN